MQLKDMLNSDIDQVIDWITNNQHDYVIVPRQLEPRTRRVYHRSIEEHENCLSIKGCPDDQWDEMLADIESN